MTTVFVDFVTIFRRPCKLHSDGGTRPATVPWPGPPQSSSERSEDSGRTLLSRAPGHFYSPRRPTYVIGPRIRLYDSKLKSIICKFQYSSFGFLITTIYRWRPKRLGAFRVRRRRCPPNGSSRNNGKQNIWRAINGDSIISINRKSEKVALGGGGGR